MISTVSTGISGVLSAISRQKNKYTSGSALALTWHKLLVTGCSRFASVKEERLTENASG